VEYKQDKYRREHFSSVGRAATPWAAPV